MLNASLIKWGPKREDVDVLRLPLVDLAAEVGSDRSQNMIMIGAVCARAGLLSLEETFVGMQKAMKGKTKFFEMNQKAIAKGFEAAKA